MPQSKKRESKPRTANSNPKKASPPESTLGASNGSAEGLQAVWNTIPGPKDDLQPLTEELESLIEDARFHARGGEVAHYIPELRLALEDKTGVALHFVTGASISTGDSRRYARDDKGVIAESKRSTDDSFTIQSISKVFALLYVLECLGHDEVFKRVGKEPTGDPFNASPRVRKVGELRIPYNPLINVGAILMSSLFRKAANKKLEKDSVRKASDKKTVEDPFEHFKDFLGRVCDAEKPLIVDQAVFQSEKGTGHNNRALAWQMSADGIFHQERKPMSRSTGVDKLSKDHLQEEMERRVSEVNFVEEILEWYFKQCSILVTCEHLASAAALLANGGVRPGTKEKILEEENVRTVISLMASCGMYDGSGQFAHDVGIPSKSGVGGGIISVVPGKLGMATFAPPLDPQGNSVRGLYLLKELSRKYSFSVFDRPYRTPALGTFKTDQDLNALIQRVRNEVVPEEKFKKADYIPELTSANALDTGFALCFVDSDGRPRMIKGGESDEPFTMQSISTLFAFLYALNRQGEGIVFSYVGKEPSGEPFDELKWQNYKRDDELRKIPFNPMINAGAIVLATMIPDHYSREASDEPIHGADKPKEKLKLLNISGFMEFVRRLCGNEDIEINWQVYESERKTGFSNRSLTWKMNDKGVFDKLLMRHNVTVDADVIEDILSVYIRLCSIQVTCEDLARAGAVLANRGKLLDSEEYLITPRNVSIATAMLSSSGLFDGSGEFAYSVGVPSKSGVSGGLIGLVPGKLGLAAYSPVVDDKGNSIRGQELFRALANDEHLSIFSGPRPE